MQVLNRLTPISLAVKIGAGLLAGSPAAPLLAEGLVLEEVTVTARQRSESLQDVPVSVTAFTESQIDDAGITRAADFLQLTSNVTFASSESAGVNFMTIRGISQVRNGESPVAVVIDGVLMTDPGQFDQELFDIQQIEVLKGPQGALYGRNAIGGAINIMTKRPSDEVEGKVVVGAGNGDLRRIQGAVSGPLAENLFFRLAGSYVDHEGYIENEYLGEEADPYEDQSFKARLEWQPSEQLSLDFRAGYSETEGGALNFVLLDNCGESNGCFAADRVYDSGAADNTRTPIRASRLGTNERELSNVSLKIDYDFDFGTLTSITAWNDQSEFYAADAYPYDCGPACSSGELRVFDTSFGPMVLENEQLVKVFTDVETISQEFRITSSDDQTLRWIAGAYYLATDRERGLPTEMDMGQPYSSSVFNENTLFGFADDNDNTAYALFGQINYDVTDTIEASLAVRYDRDEREQTDIAPPEFSATSGLT
ncbi:MAG: TonB-dependent receptor, partial [Pseudomonadota bacterium]